MISDSIKLAIAPYMAYLKVAAVLGIFLLGGWSGYALKDMACTSAAYMHEAADQAKEAEAARKLAEATQAVLDAERAHADAMAKAAAQHEDAKREVQERADAAYRAVLADNGRLRDHWQGCRATSEAIAAGAPEPDGQDRLRAESLRRILEWVGLLQAQRDGLQEVVRADRAMQAGE